MTTEGKTTPDKAAPPLDAREVVKAAADALLGVLAKPYDLPARDAAERSHLALRALLAQPPADSVARLVEAIRGVDALRNYFMEHLEGCDSPGTRMSLEIHRDIADRAITALDAHRASLDALGAGAGRKRLRVCTHADAHGSCCVPRTGDGFCIWCGSNIPADPDDMRAQRDHNAATAVRTQTEWRKALLAITPAGLLWPDPKPTEIETLREATAAIGGALRQDRDRALAERDEARTDAVALRTQRDEARKERDSDRRLVKMMEASREELLAERDTLKADLAALRADPTTLRYAAKWPADGKIMAQFQYAAHAVTYCDRWRKFPLGAAPVVVDLLGDGSPPAAKPEASGAKAPTADWYEEPKPAPAPLDPRAVAIYEGAMLLDTSPEWSPSGASVDTVEKYMAETTKRAAQMLRAAEAEAARGGAGEGAK